MISRIVEVSCDVRVANQLPIVIFGGLNVLEDRDSSLRAAEVFQKACASLRLPLVFKASWDKANRSSISSFRGVGLDEGMDILSAVKQATGLPVITDVHEPAQVAAVAEVADVVQIPAFLARQTDLVMEVGRRAQTVNIKKPQYLSPTQMANIVHKLEEVGNRNILLCERGTQFGYDNLVVDILGFREMTEASGGYPVIFDVTHSLQRRDPGSAASGGRRRQLPELARAGVAAGIGGLFIEAHEEPANARCDGPSALPMALLSELLAQVKAVDECVKAQEHLEVD